jgi:hypothetical protein
MNMRSLRKRLDRLEKVMNTKTEAATLATAPAPKPSQEEEDRVMLGLLGMCRMWHTAEEKAEFERLSALYPSDEVEPDLSLPPELDWEPFLKSIREILGD